MNRLDCFHRVVARGHTYFYFRPTPLHISAGAARIRLPDGEEAAKAEAARLTRKWDSLCGSPELSSAPPGSAPKPWSDYQKRLRAHAKTMTQNARLRAKRSGVECEVDPPMIVRLLREQRFRCAVSGIEFDLDANPTGAFRAPWRPSIDRIEQKGPYSASNVRLVCTIANWAMGEWGYAALRTLAEAVVENGNYLAVKV